jgi:phospholipid-translocating ATPase
MFDATYQSIICFFMTYLLFAPASANSHSGQSVDDRERMGVYVACATIVVVNLYVLINTYRWDWLMLLIVSISILLIWFWTGVYSAFRTSEQFYKAAPQVFGQLTFWAVSFLTVVLCLLPRFTAKVVQKIYFPLDVDIIREQVRQGRFKHLDDSGAKMFPPKVSSTTSSEITPPAHTNRNPNLPDDERPIYPPSIAPTTTTHGNPRSQTGSDGTEYTRHQPSPSIDRQTRPSFDRARPSFDRIRSSMDRVRPSFEASNDFTSAALLARIESSHSHRTCR